MYVVHVDVLVVARVSVMEHTLVDMVLFWAVWLFCMKFGVKRELCEYGGVEFTVVRLDFL